jgi:hypothetical protein
MKKEKTMHDQMNTVWKLEYKVDCPYFPIKLFG